MFNFEKLDVWQLSVDFADEVYEASKGFPKDELFALTNQIRRASVSISSNIAEGTLRGSVSDYARFVEIATGSLFEVVSQAFVAKRRGYLTQDRFQSIYTQAERIGRMLSGLRNSLIAK